MEINETIGFLFERADSMLTFWHFYIIVSTAFLGFFSAVKAEWLNKPLCFFVTFAFALFAFGNLLALIQVQEQRSALVNLMYQIIEASNDTDKDHHNIRAIADASRPPAKGILIFFHVCLDIAVISFIWVMSSVRRRRVETNS